jgi:hypothetical protein
MTWRKSSAMKERLLFAVEHERDKQMMTDMCLKFGIARKPVR